MDSKIVTNLQVVYKIITIMSLNAHCENINFVIVISIFSEMEFSTFVTLSEKNATSMKPS